jgi:hypothetical protein
MWETLNQETLNGEFHRNPAKRYEMEYQLLII